MKSNSGVLSNQKIQFFSDASCTAVFGSLIDLASKSAQSYTFSAANGTYAYRIISIDTAGNSNTSSCATPIVIDDLTDATLSSFTAVPASIPADGSATVAITVTILDSQSTPISGKVVSVSSSRGNIDAITASSAVTNSSGQATFTLKSTRIGFPTLTASVVSDGVTLNPIGHVTLLAAGSTPQTDYQAGLATGGQAPGSNTLFTSSFKDLTQLSDTNNGTLYNFGYTTSSGWSGNGSLLTTGALGPNRLVFNGTSNYADFGTSINPDSSFTFETWIRPQNPTSGSVILSTADSSNKGFNLSQLSDGSGKVSLAPAGVTSVYSQAVLADNPLFYWKLNEVSGTTAADFSGNGFGGIYSGTVSFVQSSLIKNSDASAYFTTDGNGHF